MLKFRRPASLQKFAAVGCSERRVVGAGALTRQDKLSREHASVVLPKV